MIKIQASLSYVRRIPSPVSPPRCALLKLISKIHYHHPIHSCRCLIKDSGEWSIFSTNQWWKSKYQSLRHLLAFGMASRVWSSKCQLYSLSIGHWKLTRICQESRQLSSGNPAHFKHVQLLCQGVPVSVVSSVLAFPLMSSISTHRRYWVTLSYLC